MRHSPSDTVANGKTSTTTSSVMGLSVFAIAVVVVLMSISTILTQPSSLLTIVPVIVLIGTLLVLFVQLYLENKEQVYLAYERLRSDFTTSSLTLVEHPEILDWLDKSGEKPANVENHNLDMAETYLDATLGLFERVWKARALNKIDRQEWQNWANWLKDLCGSYAFDQAYPDLNLEVYYKKGFANYIVELVEISKEEKKSGTSHQQLRDVYKPSKFDRFAYRLQHFKRWSPEEE